MRRVVLYSLALVLVAAVLAGCGPARKVVSLTAPKPVDHADAIDLWLVPPAAVNRDNIAGPDGVQVNVFLYQADRAEPVLVKGTLEFMMYEGRRPRKGMETAQPFRTWKYTEQELGTHEMRGPAGWGYMAQLGWGKDVPKSAVVTLAVRYLPPSGPPVTSAPIVIPIPK
ncbi:MAG: hypothetical protein NTY65_08395 [Planctomycetota bacterium]|nr:hypothetical protein [Planctomycetota bacterium]